MKELEKIFEKEKAIEKDVLSTSVNDLIIDKKDINKIKSLFKALEKERDELKIKLGNANSQIRSLIKGNVEIEQRLKLEQELQTLKLKMEKLKKESKEWEQKYRDERESHFESMADGDL